MDDEQKADLARKGMRAAELLEPGRIKDEAKERVTDAVENAALEGLAKVARWTGQDRSPGDAVTECVPPARERWRQTGEPPY